jgi:hypothetical protein
MATCQYGDELLALYDLPSYTYAQATTFCAGAGVNGTLYMPKTFDKHTYAVENMFNTVTLDLDYKGG